MADLWIYGMIGDELDGLDAKTVVAKIRERTGDAELTVHINSAGGYVAEGLAIFNALNDFPGTVTVKIDGLAASMASVIAMAGDHVIMPENALMMIHDPSGVTIGTAEDHRKAIEMLEHMGASLAGIYSRKTGLAVDRIETMMASETWLSAEQAVDLGFADEIATPVPAVAFTQINLQPLKAIPAALASLVQGDPNMTERPETSETPTTPTATVRRAKAIRQLATNAKLDAEFADELIDSGLTVAEARARIVDVLAEHQERTQPEINNKIRIDAGTSYDAPKDKAKAMGDALAARFLGREPEGPAERYRGMPVYAMMADLAGKAWITPAQAVRAAITHTQSDFPLILEVFADKVMQAGYEAAPSGLKAIARRTTHSDFRGRAYYRFGETSLEKVDEAGEYKHGTFSEQKESYKIDTYGRMFSISRQALVNDDLDAFGQAFQRFGQAAAEREASVLVDVLYGSGGLGPVMSDTKTLFHASHNNVSTGAVISVAALGTVRANMRLQKGLDGQPINVAPRFILVPAALETTAEQVLTEIRAARVDDVNPFAGKLSLVVEARLDALSATGWYVATDAMFGTIEYAYLDGTNGPTIDTREGWNVDGVEMKARLDFGAGVIDWRGLHRNPGA